jgi:hypothetical protein
MQFFATVRNNAPAFSHSLNHTRLMQKDKNPPSAGIHPFDPAEFPQVRQHGSADREEIRSTTKRTMPSRQSQKKVERSRQPRQPKTGGTGHHYRKPGTKRESPAPSV